MIHQVWPELVLKSPFEFLTVLDLSCVTTEFILQRLSILDEDILADFATIYLRLLKK